MFEGFVDGIMKGPTFASMGSLGPLVLKNKLELSDASGLIVRVRAFSPGDIAHEWRNWQTHRI